MRAAAMIAALCGLNACASGPVVYAPPSSQAYANVLVGRLAELRQDHAASAAQFSQALMLTPADPTLQDAALAATLAIDDVETAGELSREALSRQSHVAYARFLPAIDAINAERWGQARSQLALAEFGARAEHIRRILLAWTDAGAGRHEAALAGLASVQSSRAYNAVLTHQRALAFDYFDEAAAARTAYEESLRSGLWSQPMAERFADHLARAGSSASAARVLRGREGRFAAAAALAAIARIEAGESASTAPLDPAHGAAMGLFALGQVFLEEGDFINGLATLTLALKLDPALDAARIAFAEAKLDLGQTEDARAALNKVSAASPYAESARLMEAFVSVRERRIDEAVAIAGAVAQDGGSLRAHRALADLYRAAERFADAEPIYTELIESAPDGEATWSLLYARGIARERLDRWDEAQADLRAALASAPDQPEVLNYLGYTWVDRGENFDEALSMIQRAAALRPDSGAITDSLGWAHFKRGDYETALELLERAVLLSPSDSTINDHLGDVYWRHGRRIEARFQWRRAIALDVTEAEREAIAVKLERGLPPAPGSRSASR